MRDLLVNESARLVGGRLGLPTLLSRAGVTADTGERVLGHAIPGVRGVYDRHSFFEQKRDALERLAGTIEEVLKPRSDQME